MINDLVIFIHPTILSKSTHDPVEGFTLVDFKPHCRQPEAARTADVHTSRISSLVSSNVRGLSAGVVVCDALLWRTQ